MMTSDLSPIAAQVPHRADAMKHRAHAWGFLLHTTGGGIPAAAKRRGTTPLHEALSWYKRSQDGENGYPWGGPGYLIDHDGGIYQLAPDLVLTNHAGSPDRARYMDGSWERALSAEAVARWRAKWPGVKSPQSLYPSRGANQDYVGCEMIPCGDGFGVPMRPGLKFTKAQHDAAVELGRDLAARHSWPAGWALTSRLLGHEDVQPLQRSDKHGGWDPGWLRADPYFDFESVRLRCNAP
jgi:hypothetical protein